MLWEAVDPADALLTRFGFDGLASAADWLSTALTAGWQITMTSCSRLVISDRKAISWIASSHGPLVVKWSSAQDRFGDLEATAGVVRSLHRRGIPVAAPLAGTDGRLRMAQVGPRGALSIEVLPELSGEWLDVGDAAAVRSAGACLAELHRALADLAVGRDPETELEDVRAQIHRWLAHDDRGRVPAASARLAESLATLPLLDQPRQLLHNDFRAANILTRGGHVVAVLDFDEIVRGHTLSDLAKASVFLGTRFTDWRPTPIAVRTEFRLGYESVQPLSPTDRRWLDALVLWHGLRALPFVPDPAGWAAAVKSC